VKLQFGFSGNGLPTAKWLAFQRNIGANPAEEYCPVPGKTDINMPWDFRSQLAIME
jgi:hypothetical protein